jgi:hypothetical protein
LPLLGIMSTTNSLEQLWWLLRIIRLTGCFPIIKKRVDGVFALSYWLYMPFFATIGTLFGLSVLFYKVGVEQYGFHMFFNASGLIMDKEITKVLTTDGAANTMHSGFLTICLVSMFIANHKLFKRFNQLSSVLETNGTDKPYMKGEAIKLGCTYLCFNIVHVLSVMGMRLSLYNATESESDKSLNIMSITCGLFAMIFWHLPSLVAEILFRFSVTFVTKELKNGQKINIILSKIDIIEELFGTYLVINVFYSLFTLTFDFYTLMSRTTTFGNNVEFYLSHLLNGTIPALRIYWVTKCVNDLTRSLRNYRVQQYNQQHQHEEEQKHFLDLVKEREAGISARGYFYVNKQLIPSLICNLVTYFIVLAQFRLGEIKSK